ncbi:MAG: hypothetical protein HDR80_01600 [Bacteroides sp.]|nr:hypothetical protein [Bacteroides sp.]
MAENDYTVFSDLLACMGVRHTVHYSNRRFRTMPFQTMFGLKKLLEEYGIGLVGLQLPDGTHPDGIPTPFIAQTVKGLVIVRGVKDGKVDYLSQSVAETADAERFTSAMTGRVFIPVAGEGAGEPGYGEHRFTDMANYAKKWILGILAVALAGFLFVANGLYSHVSTVLLTLIDIAGLYITWLLVQKSAHIKNRHADAVCSVVEAGGCDDILNTDASKFFGIFGWSEVGFAYFSVSLLCLLVFPQYIGYLALCNAVCLPFSFWSVWYQKFRAGTWCTLCLCVQASLWLLFFCYLGGGWFRDALPLHIEFFVLGATYVAVMLGLNAIMPLLDRNK